MAIVHLKGSVSLFTLFSAQGRTIVLMLDGLGQTFVGFGDAAMAAASGPNGKSMSAIS
jgi:hypothetical protein